jgi:ribosomal-protein-alanine N-acetyltransferase
MSKVVKLSLARLADAKQIALMSRDLIEIGLHWKWTPAKIAAQIRCPDTVVVVARAQEPLIGFAIMHFFQEHAHLLLLAVAPSYQRSGTGRELLEWLEKSARVAGITTINLEVRAGNHGARAFYRTLGYWNAQVVPGYYGRESAVRMARTLRATY